MRLFVDFVGQRDCGISCTECGANDCVDRSRGAESNEFSIDAATPAGTGGVPNRTLEIKHHCDKYAALMRLLRSFCTVDMYSAMIFATKGAKGANFRSWYTGRLLRKETGA